MEEGGRNLGLTRFVRYYMNFKRAFNLLKEVRGSWRKVAGRQREVGERLQEVGTGHDTWTSQGSVFQAHHKWSLFLMLKLSSNGGGFFGPETHHRGV